MEDSGAISPSSVTVTAASTVAPRGAARLSIPEPLGKLLLGGLVLALHAPTLRWLGRIFTDVHFRLNAYLLLALVALVGLRLHAVVRERPRVVDLLRAPPRAARAPIALLLVSELAFLVAARWLDANIVAAVLLGTSLYAVAGLYISPTSWRRGLPGLLVFLAVLPFGEALEAYAGMPARHLTARIVEHTLAMGRIASIPAETVLVLESGLVYVDAPCSGVRSLWTGLVFFSGATWLQRAPIDARWILRGVVFVALLVTANVFRVFAIVLLAPVAGAHQLAAIVHEPLGILGFVAACAVGYLLLRGGAVTPSPARASVPRLSGRVVLGLAAVTLAALIIHTPRPRRPPVSAPRFALLGEPIALTAAEAGLFARVGQTIATKHRFTWRGHAGSLLAVHSTSWRAHHAPEICLAGAGHRIDVLQSWSLAPDRTLRVATLDGGACTALYWYQSRTRTTDDLLARVFADLHRGEAEWVMVSILVEGRWPIGEERTLALFEHIRASVEDALSAPRGPS